jgi:hypothetical protein
MVESLKIYLEMDSEMEMVLALAEGDASVSEFCTMLFT